MRYFLMVLFILKIQLFASGIDTLCLTDNSQIIPENGKLLNTTYTLKILLVQFTDVLHDQKYKAKDWLNLFFSKWTYATPNMTSPDGETVYGSMRDYYSLMSDGEFEINGYIINTDNDNDGEPDWITLPHTKNYYHVNTRLHFSRDVWSAATEAGFDIRPNGSTKLCIIYAGHMYRHGGGLTPHATDGKYVMSEKYAASEPYDTERVDATFAGIGVHCHEFGHLLGWVDTYRGPNSNTFWTLMACGQYNKRTRAPAPICPEFRIAKGWATAININSDITFSADYDLKDPEVFKIEFSSDPDRYFLIENRSFNSTMNFNGMEVQDYNNFLPWNEINNPDNLPSQGLLVWAYKKKVTDPHWSYLIQADGENNALTNYNTCPNDPGPNYHTGDSGDPFPGYSGNKVFSPWSFPISLCNGPSPSSYPSTNVGFEITEMGFDYIKVDLYCDNPENIKPQTPRNVDKDLSCNHPKINWDANFASGFVNYEYEVWKNGSYFKSTSNNFFTDKNEINYTMISKVKKYVHYRIKAKDSNGKVSGFSQKITFVVEDEQRLTNITKFDVAKTEDNFRLLTNFPNPFNPITNISFSLAERSSVTLKIYNMLGKEVAVLADDIKGRGLYSLTFDGSGFSSGVYLYILNAKGLQSGKRFSKVKRMLLIK